ncbi:beta-1,6-N-acetylglucosaminyltransferase [Acidisoma sp. L85]|uniref:beta-1,6-N-acetylglucosaminyltransferase n=1 Tax=Acidisoma sp. L85 TaxID=1641850 RepID=UPI00131E6335|nr:beta-1,6-N-acetylglucosaminyltransferase [Acidisoma sp. L85]
MSEAGDAQALNPHLDHVPGRVAYLILAHAADEQLRLLTNQLLADPRSTVYLHLDAKVSNLGWIGVYGASRLVVLPNRKVVNWGGYSIVDATILLLERALLDKNNQRFVLLSGSCFPLKPVQEINDAVCMLELPSIALWGRVDPMLKQGEGLGRYVVTKFHPHDNRFLTPKASGLHGRLWNAYKWLNSNLPYELKVDLRDLWKGSQFFIIDRHYAEVCVRPPADLVRALRYALAPDEILFTTLIVRHSRSRGSTISTIPSSAGRQGGHFVLKRVPNRRSLLNRIIGQVDLRQLTVSDVDDASASGALFARKCSADVSNAIYRICIKGRTINKPALDATMQDTVI